jgi:phenylpropionate dioxygenase-like ring-hydroxylating dioxygenase large terminal subunit
MFDHFANVWTIVGLPRDFAADRLYPLALAGERVVLFRDAGGALVGLIDRCPHRGVALSLGKIDRGIVQCPFHGWRFDGAGRNVHVPWNPDAKCANLGALSLPVRESGGFAWVYTGFAPTTEPILSETLADPRWNVHWTRAMENMLDSPHLPFVHKRSIGRGLAKLVGNGGRMDVSWTPTNYGALIDNQVEGRPSTARLDFRFPNAMELHIDPPGRRFRMIAVCLPESATHTQMCIYTVRDFARSRLFDSLFRWSNRRIAAEDQAVLESSSPLSVPTAGAEKSVRTDAPTLAFRKLYFEQLASSSAVPPPA